MRVTTLIKVFIVVFGVLACANVIFSFLATNAKYEMAAAYEARLEFMTATYDFNTLSMLLTSYARVHAARTYAQTGNEHEPYNMYWALYNNDTRMDDAIRIFVENTDVPQEELDLIRRVQTYSRRLRAIEHASIAAANEGHVRLSIQLMYGAGINDYLNPISDTLDRLNEIMLVRIQGRVDEANRRVIFFDYMLFAATILFALVSVLSAIHLHRVINNALSREREAAIISTQEESLRKAAEEESRAKTQFLARMSHEIRTPMNAVLGITEIELLKANHSPETEEAFTRIHSSSKLLLSVINDILDLSKVEAGKMEIVAAPYDVTQMLMDTVHLNMMHIGSKNIEFKLDVNENLPISLIGDELRIKQVLNNFLSNAFKYTNEGSVTLCVGKVGEAGDGKDISLIVTISDTGQGMSSEALSKLFESEYTRFNVQANRAIEGTGLGMNIARRLVSMMDGKISVKSEVGKGSTFIIKFPQKISGDEVLGKEAAENLRSLKAASEHKMSSMATEPMPYGKVLVVDDIETNLYVVEGYLAPYRVQLETALSGQEAINKVKEGNEYDILFMDHMMPEMDGIEATRILRQMGYERPIVALTANTVKGAKELFLSSGFTGFIAKPIDLYQLNAQLNTHIRDKQTPETLAAARASATDAPEKPQAIGKIEKSFLRDAEKAVKIMQETTSHKDVGDGTDATLDAAALKAFSIQAHGLKSALANINRNALSKDASILEDAANAADINTVLAKAPDFIKGVQAVMAELSPPQPSEAAAHDTPDPEHLSEQLKIISDACDNYDKKTAQRTLRDLQQQNLSQKTSDLLSEIEAKLLHSEFEEIVELLQK